MITGRPHFGQTLSVASSVTSDFLTDAVFSFTRASNGTKKSRTTGTHSTSPAATRSRLELHPGGEAEVDDVREVLGQEINDREAHVLGNERALLAPYVVPIDERRDRGRVRGRPADAVLLERLDERRFR